MIMPIQTHLNSFVGLCDRYYGYSEHEMSTAKKFVLHDSSSASFKMSATKNGDECPSVPPSLPLCRPRYLTDSAHISYSYCYFFRILQQFEILWMHTDQCEDCFHYQSTVHNIQGSYWYFAQPLSWVGAWTLDYGVSISIFYNYLEFRNLCIHIDWCLSLDSLLP